MKQNWIILNMTYKILNIDKEIKLLKAILYLVISLF